MVAVTLLLFAFAISVYAAVSYRANVTETVQVDEHGVCRNVTNNFAIRDVFVPTKLAAEWAAFRGNVPTGVSLSNCVVAVNGSCDNSAQNACSAGTANDAAIADTSTHYRWRCDGSGGGSNSGTCQIAKPPSYLIGLGCAECPNGWYISSTDPAFRFCNPVPGYLDWYYKMFHDTSRSNSNFVYTNRGILNRMCGDTQAGFYQPTVWAAKPASCSHSCTPAANWMYCTLSCP